MPVNKGLPVVDLAPFLADDGEEDVAEARARAIEVVIEACRTYGFFRVINHGVPPELMSRSLELSAAFFALPDEEKAKVRYLPGVDTPLPAGYNRLPSHSPEQSETILTFQPHLGHNLYPAEPHGLRKALDEVHENMAKLGILIQDILTEGMGLPPGFLREYTTSDNSFHLLLALHYFPAEDGEAGKIGARKHKDSKLITFVIQDHVGGLEVLNDGDWVPVEPVEESIIVNIGDIIEVLSNKKLKSATHRVLRKSGMHRHSFAYFVNVDRDKWIEPLPEFTDKVGEPPHYRGFPYDEYQKMRMRNKTDPPATAEEFHNLTHYAI